MKSRFSSENSRHPPGIGGRCPETEPAGNSRKGALSLINMLKKLHREESGQDLIEYALVAALIAVASVAAMKGVATAIGNEFTKVSGELT